MIQTDTRLYNSIHNALSEMTENLNADWDHLGLLEEAVQEEVLKAYLRALKSMQIEDINAAVSEAYREVIKPDLGPILQLVRRRVSNGTLTAELLDIYATILTDDFAHVIKMCAG